MTGAKLPWGRIRSELEAAATARGRARLGLCSIEGVRLFERALAAGARLERGLASRAFLADDSPRARELRARLEAHGCTLVPVPDETLAELTGGRDLGGLLGLARLPAVHDLEDLASHLVGPGGTHEPALFVACVSFQDPGNVGAVARTAHAVGAAALLSVGSTDAFHPRAVRTSKGSVFRLPVARVPDVASLVRELAALGVRSLGAVTSGGVPLPRLPRPREPTALVLGSEAFGLGPAERAALDDLVTIPMAAEVDSFSVNAAAATLLYALRHGALP